MTSIGRTMVMIKPRTPHENQRGCFDYVDCSCYDSNRADYSDCYCRNNHREARVHQGFTPFGFGLDYNYLDFKKILLNCHEL